LWTHAVFAVDGQDVTVTRSIIESRLDALSTNAEIDEEQAAELSQLYRQTLGHLETRSANRAATKAFNEAHKTAADKAQKIRELAAKDKERLAGAVASINEDTSLAEIVTHVQKAKADLAADSTRLSDYAARLEKEAGRSDVIRRRLSEIVHLQDKLVEEAQPVDADTTPPALIEARRWKGEAYLAELRAEVRTLDAEL
jgi:hypothetical protein